VEVRWLPFELNPEFPPEGMARQEYRIEKFGSLERSHAADAKVTEAGQAEGLPFDFGRIEHTPNTFLAHRLMAWAQSGPGSQRRLAEALFGAYFSQGRDIGRAEVLIAVATEAGLDPAAAEEALAAETWAKEVRALEWEMMRRGINGVPFFNVWGIGASGAAPTGSLKEVFDMAIARRTSVPSA